jgi:hypothetical protein
MYSVPPAVYDIGAIGRTYQTSGRIEREPLL